jgi:hypothetical protein
MSSKFLQGAISRGLREAGAVMREEAGVLEVSTLCMNIIDQARRFGVSLFSVLFCLFAVRVVVCADDQFWGFFIVRRLGLFA